MLTKGKAMALDGIKKEAPSICVITPTLGRKTLYRALTSASLSMIDSWIVVLDDVKGDRDVANSTFNNLSPTRPYLSIVSHVGLTSEYGNKLRDLAMKMSNSDYFLFLDDDDIFAPHAMDIVKIEIAQSYPRPIIFSMINGNGEKLWKNREVTPGNVGSSMFCCPNIPGKLGVWDNGAGHRSDFEFIQTTLKMYGPGWRQRLVWSDKVIVECRPKDEL